MPRVLLISFLFANFLTSVSGFAVAEGPEILVERAVLATAVEDREPAGVAEKFPADVGVVYFHTTLTGEFGETTVEHVWLREGEEMARVLLEIRSPRFRTWTAKKIPAAWAGSWEVRLLDGNGGLLRALEFEVE